MCFVPLFISRISAKSKGEVGRKRTTRVIGEDLWPMLLSHVQDNLGANTLDLTALTAGQKQQKGARKGSDANISTTLHRTCTLPLSAA